MAKKTKLFSRAGSALSFAFGANAPATRKLSAGQRRAIEKLRAAKQGQRSRGYSS